MTSRTCTTCGGNVVSKFAHVTMCRTCRRLERIANGDRICPTCGKSFRTPFELRRHINRQCCTPNQSMTRKPPKILVAPKPVRAPLPPAPCGIVVPRRWCCTVCRQSVFAESVCQRGVCMRCEVIAR